MNFISLLEAQRLIKLDGRSLLDVIPLDGTIVYVVDGIGLESGRVEGEVMEGERGVSVESEGSKRWREDLEEDRAGAFKRLGGEIRLDGEIIVELDVE